MAVRYRPGLSFRAAVLVERLAACVDGEHAWKCVDELAMPKYFRCDDCKIYGFIRRKGGAHRNGRMVVYMCSTKKCRLPARIRSRYRGTGGAFDWACGVHHAKGEKYVGRVMPDELLPVAAE